jgi:ribonuclease HI
MKQEVINRKLQLCEYLLGLDVEQLQQICDHCNLWYMLCCSCNGKRKERMVEAEKSGISWEHIEEEDGMGSTVCHHFRLVFVDGAAINNGKPTARAGFGCVVSYEKDGQISLPVVDSVDGVQKRSNQRAELLAAITGLHLLDQLNPHTPDEVAKWKEKSDKVVWVIASDSEYVVKGMTEWFLGWKVCLHLTSILSCD